MTNLGLMWQGGCEHGMTLQLTKLKFRRDSMSEIIQTLSKVKNYNSQKMSEIELLPCPFCGGKAEVRATKRLVFNGKYMGTVHYVVGCIDTKCIGRIQRRYNSIEEAIDAWSTRKTIHRIVEQLEREKE